MRKERILLIHRVTLVNKHLNLRFVFRSGDAKSQPKRLYRRFHSCMSHRQSGRVVKRMLRRSRFLATFLVYSAQVETVAQRHTDFSRSNQTKHFHLQICTYPYHQLVDKNGTPRLEQRRPGKEPTQFGFVQDSPISQGTTTREPGHRKEM